MATLLHPITHYQTIVFDCDGVILDSNIVKTEAYFRTAKRLNATDSEAQALVDYHVQLGGISRYHKFEYYLQHIRNESVADAKIQQLLDVFAEELEEGLLNCEIAKGLEALRAKTSASNWLILSGGDQKEIRALFAKRDLAHYFNGGLFGSPDNKDEVLARELASSNIRLPALFVGDSKYDFEASNNADLDFVFLSDWTEVPDWQTFCAEHDISIQPNVAALNKLG